MPISVTCPECSSTYRVADDAAGKAIKCKKCGARVAVPSGDDDLSALKAGNASNGDDGGDAKAKKKGGSGKLIAIIAGALVGTCCICTGVIGVGVWWGVGKAKEASKDFVAQFDKKFQEEMEKAQRGAKEQKGPVVAGVVIFEKKETLTDKSPKFANKPAIAYKVKLESGKRYVIDMKHEPTKPGDPYLFLLDAKGKELARDDDGGGNLDAQITFSPPATAEYTIQATVLVPFLPPDGMTYTLTVRQL
jgi:predicted Zn finger-like uncharacterized protein